MTPSVLFVCVRNGVTSQKAAGLMRTAAAGRVVVHSAETSPGPKTDTLSVDALAEVGVDITGETPKPVGPELQRTVDVVVTLGREAQVDVRDGVAFHNWDTDEPSERGIEGIERMRLVCDDIGVRVQKLLTELDTARR